jgi:hypothetical protein
MESEMTDSRFEGDRTSLSEVLQRATAAINAKQAIPDQEQMEQEAVGPTQDYGERSALYIEEVGLAAVRKAQDFNERCMRFAAAIRAEFGKLAKSVNDTMGRTNEAIDTIKTLADNFETRKNNGQ